jgi:peptidoglycan/LPS O-acetylase OafA/YrhL
VSHTPPGNGGTRGDLVGHEAKGDIVTTPSTPLVRSGDTSSLPPLTPHFRPDVQGLRALAVVLVILDHAGVARCAGGFIGVDVFFVISGFVITQSLLAFGPGRLASHLSTFYGRRIRRIVPAATLTLVATLVGAYVALGHGLPPLLIGDVRWASLFGENLRLTATSANYFIPGITPSLVTQFWSLAVEEQYYLFYPVVFLTTLTLAPPRLRQLALRVVVGAGVVASAWWSWHATGLAPISSYYSLLTRFWELALGGLVALAPASWRCRSRVAAIVVALAALGVLAVTTTRLSPTSVYPGVLAWWPCAAAAALLWSGERAATGGPYSWLAWRPVRYVGDLSYSLYLWHYAWLVLPLYLYPTPPSGGARALEVAAAVGCAVLSYHLVENPLRHSSRLRRDPVSTLLVLVICLAVTWDATFVVTRLVAGH